MALAFALYWGAFVQGRVSLSFAQLLILGMSARALALWVYPCDDIHRYVWEARAWLEGFNPYVLAPDHPHLEPLRNTSWALINHPSHPAIYPPLIQMILALLASISASPLFFKIAFTLAEIPALLLFRRLQQREGAPETTLAVFFLNPLLILEVAGRGHFESLLLVFALAFLVYLPARIFLPAAFFLSASVLIKVISLAWLPLLMSRRGAWQGAAGVLLILALTLSVLYLSGALANVAHFGQAFTYNSMVPYLLNGAAEGLGGSDWRDWTARVIFLLCIPMVYFHVRHRSPASQGLWWMGLTLLFLPTVHPWYLLWVLPFASMRLNLPWLLMTGTILVNYFVNYRFHLGGSWQEVHWLRWPQYLPPLALGIFTWLRSRTPSR